MPISSVFRKLFEQLVKNERNIIIFGKKKTLNYTKCMFWGGFAFIITIEIKKELIFIDFSIFLTGEAIFL